MVYRASDSLIAPTCFSRMGPEVLPLLLGPSGLNCWSSVVVLILETFDGAVMKNPSKSEPY